ncbi:MAG: sugar phosphate nucleotidyltransferase [bacterium]|nr:sugar phosphate nucleotidyltransferase [bacterium]
MVGISEEAASQSETQSETDLSIIVLAAGLGKRMKSNLAKVLHEICDKPMIDYVLDTLSFFLPAKIVVVVGHQAEEVTKLLKDRKVAIVLQRELLGTGHAVAQTSKVLSDFEGNILIVCGDTPLLKRNTLTGLIQTHRQSEATITILTVTIDDPAGYGRVVIDSMGQVCKIIEDNDASEEEKAIKLVNTGSYCFKGKKLFAALKKLSNDNKQGEFYLTDVVEILKEEGEKIVALEAPDPIEVMGINTQEDLRKVEEIKNYELKIKELRDGSLLFERLRLKNECEI